MNVLHEPSMRRTFAKLEGALPRTHEILRRHHFTIRPARIPAQMKSPFARIGGRFPARSHPRHRRERFWVVLGQAFIDGAHSIRIGRSSRQRRIEDLRQSAIAPTKLLRARRERPAIILLDFMV